MVSPANSGPEGLDRAASAPVTVRFFASAAEAAGVDVAQLPLPAQATPTAAGLLAALATAYPGALAQLLPRCGLFVNERTAPAGTPLRPGDVVDILPPFAGG